MAKVKKSMPVEAMQESPPYDHRIEMRRTDGSMKMTHLMPMGKNRKGTEKTVKAMIDKMFGSVKK